VKSVSPRKEETGVQKSIWSLVALAFYVWTRRDRPCEKIVTPLTQMINGGGRHVKKEKKRECKYGTLGGFLRPRE